jgi:pyruvate/2-oxoglutarate dehydrogenase complex dihydrolipoamide dehydrogenase (E3) component
VSWKERLHPGASSQRPTGAWPDIPGLDPERAVWAGDVNRGKAATGQRVLIMGGGATGCETALFLAQQGKQVTIVEKLLELCPTFNACNRTMLLEFLGEHKVDMRTGTIVLAVKDGAVTVSGPDGKEYDLGADTILNALGARPRTEVVETLKGLAGEVYVVGDCAAPRIIYDAVHEGFEAAIAM